MTKEDKINAQHFNMIAELLQTFAGESYKEWSQMKYVKAREGRPGHESKKKFDEYRMFVYSQYKLRTTQAGLCRAVVKSLTTGGDMDFEEFAPDSPAKAAGKIILGSFKNLIP